MQPFERMPSDDEQRRHERRKTLLAAKLATSEGVDDCVVHDLSSGGAEISSVATLVPSQKVTLILPRAGRVPGRVAWVSERRWGMQFVSPLDAKALSGLLAPSTARRGGPEDLPEPTAPQLEEERAARQAEERRAALEAQLIAATRELDERGLEVAIEQVALLARLRD